jgi:hypothetical protein
MATWRVLFGFVVAPGVPALALYLLGLSFASAWEAAWGPRILAMFAYLVAVAGGIPVHLFLQAKGINSVGAYVVAGALIGLVCYLLVFGIWVEFSWQSSPEHASALLRNSVNSGLIAVAYGAIASVLFWLIAIRRSF